jgi:hypothetical protein
MVLPRGAARGSCGFTGQKALPCRKKPQFGFSFEALLKTKAKLALFVQKKCGSAPSRNPANPAGTHRAKRVVF